MVPQKGDREGERSQLKRKRGTQGDYSTIALAKGKMERGQSGIKNYNDIRKVETKRNKCAAVLGKRANHD